MQVKSNIKLIVGLGNPGQQYEATRHNVGAWFVEAIAKQENISMRFEQKFKGFFASIHLNRTECKLLIPTTFMNKSGLSVNAIINFYKIPIESILIAHDDLDFETGIVKLKYDGGTAGHNGLEDIAKTLKSKQFYRLRFGIGRPQSKDIVNYVLGNPSRAEKIQITDAVNKALVAIPELLHGSIDKAMQFING